jgi:hypothetical protein
VTVSAEVGTSPFDQFAAVFQLPALLFFQLTFAIGLSLCPRVSSVHGACRSGRRFIAILQGKDGRRQYAILPLTIAESLLDYGQ